uniref:Non-specific lipid-transfer protein n=1 Tax=Euphorbia lagascae TaxID=54672 RepID=Q8S4Y2_EUPLA|nr:lipid transfer protein 2 [Euphorbia lagascae]
MEGKMVISVVVIVAIIQLMAMQGEAVDCKDVNSNLATCIPYLTGKDTAPPTTCCDGVKNLPKIAQTTADRRAACECVKAAASHYTINEKAASSLPKDCGAVINIPISKTTNCQQIN